MLLLVVEMLKEQQQQQQQIKKKYYGHRPSVSTRESLVRVAVGTILLLTLCITQTTVQAQTIQETSTVPAQRTLALPTDASYYYLGCYTARTDLLKELVYAKTPQACVEMCEHQSNSYAVIAAERCFCANDIIEQERQDEQLCNTRCLANKSQYCGGVGVQSYYSTMLAKELPAPNHLRVVNATENSLSVAWEAYEPRKMYIAGAEVPAPPPQAQSITNFLIKSQMLQTYSSLPFFPQPEFIVQHTERRFEITDLHPATAYNISVSAMCGELVCGSASLVGNTVVGRPSPAPQQPRVLTSTDETITVEIPPIRNNNGPLSKVLVIVETVDESLSQPFDTQLLGSWQKAQEDGSPYYIAAELDYPQRQPGDKNAASQPRQFVVGDGKRYGRYINPPLESSDSKEAHIHVSLGVVSTLNGVTKTLYARSTHDQHATNTLNDFTYATFDSGSESIMALTITCIVFGTCLVLSLVAYFYLRYKTYRARNTGTQRMRNTHEMTMQQPIIERENNGFVVEDDLPALTAESFKQQLDALLAGIDAARRLPRNALRMNVNDIVAEGQYGEVITGKLLTHAAPDAAHDCQLHVLALDDLADKEKARLLQEFRNLTRLQRHEHLLDFYGVSASADWFYFVFEHERTSLKRRLIESRRAPHTAPVQRITALSEQLVLQWIYEIASAMEYLHRCKVVGHRQLCAHNIFVTAESKMKVAVFGPVPYVNNQKKVDIARWLAPEALRYQHYAAKSDIWSFACVAWECCSLGGTLYANLTSSQLLLDAIKSGSRPAQPCFVYQDLYQLLLNCWQLEPSERISFEEIAFSVRQLMTSPRHALCFDRVTDEMPGNNVVDMLPYYLPMLELLD